MEFKNNGEVQRSQAPKAEKSPLLLRAEFGPHPDPPAADQGTA